MISICIGFSNWNLHWHNKENLSRVGGVVVVVINFRGIVNRLTRVLIKKAALVPQKGVRGGVSPTLPTHHFLVYKKKLGNEGKTTNYCEDRLRKSCPYLRKFAMNHYGTSGYILLVSPLTLEFHLIHE